MQITSAQNNRVKEWAQLLHKKGRDRQNRYLVEGIHLVQEAVRSNMPIESIVYSIDRGIPSEIGQAFDFEAEWIGVSEAVLEKCTDTSSPQPVFAVIRKRLSSVEDLLGGADEGVNASLVVVVDGVQDPGNLGTIIRSADAVGASGILIGPGSADVLNPKAVRATMGSLFHLPIVEARLEDALPQARERGWQIISTDLDAESNCYECDFRRPTWIIVGNEGSGVSEIARSFVGRRVTIPMPGQAESLNVAMAATVLLYEALRQRRFQ